MLDRYCVVTLFKNLSSLTLLRLSKVEDGEKVDDSSLSHTNYPKMLLRCWTMIMKVRMIMTCFSGVNMVIACFNRLECGKVNPPVITLFHEVMVYLPVDRFQLIA